jgi:type VI secretion system protein ImpA
LTSLSDGIAGTVEALKSIDGRMRGEHGIEAAPEFDGLLAQLDTIQRELRTRIAARPDGQAAGAVAPGADSASPAGSPGLGRVQSREEAIRALHAVADFFRQTEPSSPIPMLLERASRLVSKDFLAVLSDLTPDAVVQARRAVGLKDE